MQWVIMRHSSSADDLHRDRARFATQLAAFEASGLGSCGYAEDVRLWIQRVDAILYVVADR
jgi:hypothetical protein